MKEMKNEGNEFPTLKTIVEAPSVGEGRGEGKAESRGTKD
jgi:hypothetical protein